MSHLSPLPHYFFVPPTKSGLPRGLNRSSFLDTPILSGHGLDPVVELPVEDSAWTILGPYQQRAYRPQRPLPHPLYSTPQRHWALAGGHQPIVTTSGAFKPPHAAQRLRPTVYRESLLPYEREQFLDRSDKLVTGRYWKNQPQHDTMAEYQTGTTVHAAPNYTNQSSTVGFNAGYSSTLNQNTVPQYQQQQNNNNNNSNNINNQQFQQFTYKPQQQKQMEIKIPIQLIGPLPGQTNFGQTNKLNYSPSPSSPINSYIKQQSIIKQKNKKKNN
ncbi:hypothetical protein Mgra_00001244 [Meloidogyne graminicola]|uniref:Uncharacterized protein n=1 Tax=Meloidogyne graminicola TaxID=189291 RepID=A0A8T0A2M3_9BILA|nr:hypothetical protein Mgra_00001244 [Meloidogyne graminicola]